MSRTTEWRKRNPEKYAASKAAYKDRQKLSDAEYYQRNKEAICARQLSYYQQNLDKVKSAQRIYRWKNVESLRSYISTWRKENSALCNTYHQNRRARLRNVGGKLSAGLADKLYKLQRGRCACCGKRLGNNYHLDHRMPLALGGSNEDSNIQLLTAKCNLQKQAKHPIVFMQSKGYLL